MSSFLRITLAWLLAVALPLQGYAAQAMLPCGPQHPTTVAFYDHAAQAHGVSHQSAASLEQTATDQGDQAHSGHDHQAKTFKSGHAGKCSVCASCCGAAALTTAVVTIDVIPSHAPVVSTIPTGTPIETLGGLDRPPRPVLA